MEGDVHDAVRRQLTNNLLDSVKQCQIRFGGKRELATEVDSRVSCLCSSWESVLQHGLKHNNKALSTLKHVTQLTGLTKIGSGISLLDDIKNMETEPTFWSYAKHHMGKHDLQRYLLLKNISTDAGRGRAWLRSAINENSLEKYMHMWVENPELISQYYEDWSFMCDVERSSMLPNMAAGLGSILFAISIDNPDLNSIKPASGLDHFIGGSPPQHVFAQRPEEELRPVIAGDSSPKVDKKKDKRRKKKAAHIVSFDEADFSSYSASPVSTVSSPKSLTFDTSSPVVTAGAVSLKKASNFKDVGATHSSFESVVPSHVKGHLRTGSCDNPLQSYASSISRQDPSRSIQNISSSLPQRSVHFGDIPEQSRVHMSPSPNKPLKDTIDVPLYQASSVVSNDSGLEDDERIKDSPENTSHTDTLKSMSDSHKADINNRDSDSLGNYAISESTSLHHSKSSDAVRNSPTLSQEADCAPSAYTLKSSSQTSKNIPGLGDIGRTESNISTVSATSDQSIQEEQSCVMTPVRPSDDSGSEAITIVCSTRTSQEDSTSDSYDSGEVLLYNHSSTLLEQNAKKKTEPVSSLSSLRTQGDGSHNPEPLLTQDTMTTEELKQAVIAMVGRKDEVEEQNKALMAALEHELSTSSTLRLEIEELGREHRQRADKDADKIRALSRENDLLKHQLKKYVNAVQMLRRQGAKAEDFPGIHLEDVQPAMPSHRPYIDYSHEASEYEKKLVQVAEMHGELMEFNEVLQKQLLVRDAVIKNLREELVNLRGPLPDDGEGSDDSMSVIDGNPETSPRPLINVWIPSAFLRGSGTDGHHVYQVFVRIREDEWNVYHRYSDFHSLHQSLKKRFPITSTFQFPPKKAIGSKEPKLVEKRRKDLQAYLRRVVNLLVIANPDLATSASKQKLVATLPFFGTDEGSDKKKKSKRESRKGAQRRASEGDEAREGAEGQQYMGL